MEDQFEYVRAIVDCGDLSWEYKLKGGREQRMAHDEDISGWSAEDIKKTTKAMLGIDDDDPVEIEIQYC